MTIAAITAVLDHFTGKPTDTLVLLALADRADKDNWECYPSIADTAARTNLCERAVRASIRRLEELGVIESMRFGGVSRSHGGLPTNRYRIVCSALLSDAAADAPWDTAPRAPSDIAADAPSPAPRGISCTPMGHIVPPDTASPAPEPRDEPSKDLRKGARKNAEARGRISPVCPHCDSSGREPNGADCQVCGGNGVNPDFRFEKRGRGRG